MLIHDLRCFGLRAGEGNRALVVEGDHADADARQAYARAQGRSATVFIDVAPGAGAHAGQRARAPEAYADADATQPAITLDYYYPHMRSPLCLHATLAAAAVLFAQRGADAPLTVTTAMHGQQMVLSRADGLIFARLARQPAPQPVLDDALVRRLLGADGVPGAARVVSVGSPKLLIEVADRATLHALAPDLDAILAWGRAHGVNGCYAWCRLPAGEPDGDVEGRNFNHLPGATEDAATGVAAGALTAMLGHGLRLLQGGAVGQACVLHTRIEGDAILVGGHAQ
jgi:PhzF family phenazine biosynthesis protein